MSRVVRAVRRRSDACQAWRPRSPTISVGATRSRGKFSTATASGELKGDDVLGVKQFGGIGQAGFEVFLTDVGTVLQDLLLGPHGGKKIDNELNGEPCAFDDWLAKQNLGVDRNTSGPGQLVAIRSGE
jgi:hypothetical protein